MTNVLRTVSTNNLVNIDGIIDGFIRSVQNSSNALQEFTQNSFGAKAIHVDIRLNARDILVIDDGCGVGKTPEEIINKIGQLGKPGNNLYSVSGIGVKAAGFFLSDEIIVISKVNNKLCGVSFGLSTFETSVCNEIDISDYINYLSFTPNGTIIHLIRRNPSTNLKVEIDTIKYDIGFRLGNCLSSRFVDIIEENGTRHNIEPIKICDFAECLYKKTYPDGVEVEFWNEYPNEHSLHQGIYINEDGRYVAKQRMVQDLVNDFSILSSLMNDKRSIPFTHSASTTTMRLIIKVNYHKHHKNVYTVSPNSFDAKLNGKYAATYLNDISLLYKIIKRTNCGEKQNTTKQSEINKLDKFTDINKVKNLIGSSGGTIVKNTTKHTTDKTQFQIFVQNTFPKTNIIVAPTPKNIKTNTSLSFIVTHFDTKQAKTNNLKICSDNTIRFTHEHFYKISKYLHYIYMDSLYKAVTSDSIFNYFLELDSRVFGKTDVDYYSKVIENLQSMKEAKGNKVICMLDKDIQNLLQQIR